jgi:hypothetical protein
MASRTSYGCRQLLKVLLLKCFLWAGSQETVGQPKHTGLHQPDILILVLIDQWTAQNLGIRHFAVRHDQYATAPNEPKVDYPEGL